MLRLAAYARVSTDEQSTIEAQLDTLTPLAIRLGGTITVTETDVLSGLNSRRPGYQRLLELARRREIEGVLVYKLDRFGRDHAESIRAANELELNGVRVYSATEPTEDPFVRDLLLLLANRETRVLSERVKLGHHDRAKQGQWQSRPPAGYRLVKREEGTSTFTTLEPDAKGPLITRLFELAATGRYTVRELRDEAHLLGLTSSTDHELSRGHIHKLLTNPAYVGDVVYGRQANGKFEAKRNRPRDDWTVVEDAHPALTTREIFAKVQAIFALHLRVQGDPRKTHYLLTSLLFCASCGSRMYGASAGRSRNGNEYFSYTCNRHASYGTCETKQVGGLLTNRLVKDQLRAIAITPESRRNAEAMLAEREGQRAQEADAQRRNLLRQRSRIEKERRDLAEGFISRGRGVVPYDVYMALEAEKVQALGIIDRTLATLDEVRPLDISGELAFLERVDWDLFDDQAWRQAVVLLIERVVAGKGEKKGAPRLEITWTPAAELIRATLQPSSFGAQSGPT